MTARKLRIMLRWMHLIIGLVLLCYIYSPFHQNFHFRMFVKWIAVPWVVLSGLWIWKFTAVNRILRIQEK